MAQLSASVSPATGVPLLGCAHYARNCQLRAACCGAWVACRLCHDGAADHALDRFATREVRCMVCGLAQGVGEACAGCGIQFATYFCAVCRFYDNTPEKSIYHCYRCGLCRVGRGPGRDTFHCDTCDACVAIDAARHRCRADSIRTDCPVCRGGLFASVTPVVYMRCGHTMHAHCFARYTREHSVCPRCRASLRSLCAPDALVDAVLDKDSSRAQ